uniref:Putative transcriptional regulatory protein n=1 Tax=Talaromyces marneffei PM1 TaxID=1077442 RepID=A0A093V7T1_TALMA
MKMDPDDTRFVCPRPRAVRACVSCKAHKTRCLPSARSDQCRRCEKIGTICLYSDVQQLKKKTQARQPEGETSALESILGKVTPATLDVDYEDQSEKVVRMHGNAFGCTEATILTTQSQTCQSDEANRQKRPRGCIFKIPHITMSQVDTMVQSYQLKTAYFPFVSIPENITAETLCQKWPFLLLSILVISSADEPILQKALDERFRKVLATRVVMQGEKSLDYLHGLLVYLSCIAMGFRRSNNFTFIPSNELLDSMLLLNDGPLEPIIASIVKLCKFIEKVHGINLQTEMAKLSSWTLECPLQKLTQMLIGELTQLERELPAHIYTKTRIQFMQRFARIKIYALALEQEKHLSQNQINPLTFLEVFPACASEIISLLQYVNTSTTEYRNLSITNWAPVIQSVVMFPKLCQFTMLDPDVARTWQDMIEIERATYLTHIDGLCDRLESTSITKLQTEQKLPDLFYLFYTVLRLFKANLMRELEQLSSGQIPPNNANQSNKPPSSRCPVVNGDIQSTDYWTMWMNSNNLMSDVELFGVQGGEFPDFDINDPAVFDWVLGLISLFDSLLILI